MRCWAVALVVACAPQVDGPVEQQRARDRADAAMLEHELVGIRGVNDAHVALARASTDPFTSARTAEAAGAVLVVDARTNISDVTRAASALLHGVVPDIEPAIAVQIAPARADHPRRWPVTIAFAAITILAGWLAWRERHRVMVRP